MSCRVRVRLRTVWRAAAFCATAVLAAGQAGVGRRTDPIESLREEIQELRQTLAQIRDELSASRTESQELRRDLQSMREQVAGTPGVTKVNDRVASIEEQQQVIGAKVDEQEQSKVASGSKYRVRLSGMALFNTAATRGAVDHLDLPMTTQPKAPGESGGSLGASLRQSLVGLEVFGPDLNGAKISGNLQFDFFGGFPSSNEGVTAGLFRLRTARLALEWKNTSIVAGQEAPFFSPRSPTSLVSTAYPSFSSAGNLWTWTPEIYVEHRLHLSERTQVSMQWGVLDALTGELPGSEYRRVPTAGEHSRTPAIAARAAWEHTSGDRHASLGAGAYFTRQDWGFQRMIDGWAATSDWDLPLGRWFSWSGELYRGRAIGGLGGGPNGSVLFTGATSFVLPIENAGGWSQLKFQPLERWQLNVVAGQDYAFGDRLRGSNADYVRRNAAAMVNIIFQARSNLLFSAEYRHLRTIRFLSPVATADHVSVGAGIIF